ncbi:hypothetical protein BC939DRAFT_467147 [Gamsiella multidivaricata]|uniref:uncharacterized protein n=1 Tax=Gamsiella multidivaricata TaxID=101098 RepID=UPI00221FA293|nr:uncharacterized protein BC939DRAFT_467147 [Gamsiella multidivaricata]KAI7817018.1 hypothetical protein BC939DRAFT_467147 [Gamsiella multidivaricata]
MSDQNPPAKAVPIVLIVGAGLGGLLLATLLERIDVPYHIFERATEMRSLGAAMTLGANILPVFEQLGLLEEIERVSLPCPWLEFYNGNMKQAGGIDLRGHKTVSGYDNLLFARPKLYELLRKQVPAEKITLGKKVLRAEEKDNKVHIHCSDNTSYHGDILIGADGAYSGVRQSLYKRLDEAGVLPKSDLESLSIAYVSMVGVATPPNPEKYPQLKDDYSHFSQVLGKDARSWGVFSVADNQICWGLSTQLSESEAKDQHFRNSEWGPESNEGTIKEFENLPIPWGGTMGDIFEATPKELTSKVFLEEKLFKTWYHSRTVLIGDACHKMLPGAGLGAVNAMQDAVVLANCIYNMKDASPKSFTAAFQEYYRQRYDRADEQLQRSGAMSKTMAGQTWTERLTRNIILNYIPDWIQQKGFAKAFEYRPQIAWLPLVENRGTGKVLPQEGERKDFGQ